MLQSQTLLKIIDNSGAKVGKCLAIFKNSNKNNAKPGDLVLISLEKTQNIITLKKLNVLKKKQLFVGLIVTTKCPFKKKSGFYYKFNENTAILLDKNKNLLGNRVNGLVLKEFKQKFNKFVNYTRYLV
jgi:large subunit ribosomal protein L14